MDNIVDMFDKRDQAVWTRNKENEQDIVKRKNKQLNTLEFQRDWSLAIFMINK